MKPQKFIVVSDPHGKEADQTAIAATLSFVREFRPAIQIIAGDVWNFAAIRKGAGEDEQAESMQDDFDDGSRFVDAFFLGGSKNYLMMGNHDARVWDLCRDSKAVRRNFGERMVADIEKTAKRNKAELVPYDSRLGIVELGHLKVIHGYHAGIGACRTHAQIYGNCIFGHVHSIEAYQVPGIEQREARAIGCLCKLDQDYINRKTAKLRWAHGWAYGWLFDDGTYQLHQARSVKGKFYASTEIKTY